MEEGVNEEHSGFGQIARPALAWETPIFQSGCWSGIKKSRVAKSSKNGKSTGQIIHRQLDVSKVTQLSCLVGHSSGLKIQKSVKGNPHSQSSMGCHAQLCNLSSTQRLCISYTMELSSWWSCISITVHSTGEHAALHMFLKYLPFSACPLFKQLNNAEEGQRSCWWHRQTRPCTWEKHKSLSTADTCF